MATKKTSATATKSLLKIRNATLDDINAITDLSRRVYVDALASFTPAEVRGHISNFPQGQFVAEYDGKVVGYCATFRIKGEIALKPHTYTEITGAGFASRHDAKGDYLYGMEVCVDPSYRRLRIGQRLYDARKKLCEALKLRGIIFGGRMPYYARRKNKVGSASDYVKAVDNQQLNDPIINFQKRNGFEILGVIEGYLPSDRESDGNAVHMVWRNPMANDDPSLDNKSTPRQQTVRVATVQFQQRRIASFEEFMHNIEYFVDVTSDYRADFVVFPELLTLQLLSLEPAKLSPKDAIEALTNYTERFKKAMQHLAVSYNINIIGGSHPTKNELEEVNNIAYVFLRDGAVHEQVKLHPTPDEKYWWNIKGGDKLATIDTDCGPIGVLICYDVEFPETARYLVDQGAMLLFVPYCTSTRQGHLRVRYCAQARAVENQCYVITSGNVGNLPNVENMDIHYAESAILTPCDFPFARDGIAADTTANTEMVAFADLHLDDLVTARYTGTVRNLRDRRFDLYSVRWKRKAG